MVSRMNTSEPDQKETPIPGLYLFPLPIASPSKHSWIGESEKSLLRSSRLIFAENERTVRRFISSLNLNIRIDEIRIERLDKETGSAKAKEYAGLISGTGHGLLMSEAGCPAIADPGSLLVDACHQMGIRVFPLVGPSSILLALIGSGLSGQHFSFHGYLPVDPAECAKKIRQLEIESAKEGRTQILIETPYRNSGIWQRLLETLKPETKLCYASGLGGDSEKIAQKRVREWKNGLPVEWQKSPSVFLFMAD